MKLITLNVKAKNDSLVSSLYELHIAHLFIISGIHISLWLKAIDFIFKDKLKKLKLSLQWFLILLYGYLIGFTLGIMRIIFDKLLAFKKWAFKEPMDRLSINGFLIGLFGIYQLSSFSFFFIFSALFAIYFVGGLPINNKIVKGVLVSILITFFSIGISVNLSYKINFIGLLFGYLLTIPILILYGFFFWLFLIPGIELFLQQMYIAVVKVISVLKGLKATINLKGLSWIGSFLYFFFLYNGCFIYNIWNKKRITNHFAPLNY